MDLEQWSDEDLEALIQDCESDEAVDAILDDLHPGQQRLIFARDKADNLANYVALSSPRRFGKTTAFLIYAIYTCLTRKAARCVMIYQHQADAREIAWPLLPELVEKYGLNVHYNNVGLTCRFVETESVIKLAGADSEKRHRQFKGQRNDLICIDECQDWHSDIKQLVDWLDPGLADRQGRLFMIGTPGPPRGYFYEVCRGEHSEWTVEKGNSFENPYTADLMQERLRRKIEANPALENDPSIRREFYGEWVIDTRKNVIQVDPAINYLYEWHPEADDEYIISIDWGDDNAAFVVATYNPRRYPWLIYLESQNLSGLIVKDYVSIIKTLQDKYPRHVLVVDPGGIAKAFKRELAEVHGIDCIPAKKEDRFAQVEFMSSDISTGIAKIYNRMDPKRPEDMSLCQQWRELVWVEKKRTGTREESWPRDLHDAALYARRYAHPYLHTPDQRPPQPGTREWHLLQSKTIREKKEKMLRQRRRKY